MEDKRKGMLSLLIALTIALVFVGCAITFTKHKSKEKDEKIELRVLKDGTKSDDVKKFKLGGESRK